MYSEQLVQDSVTGQLRSVHVYDTAEGDVLHLLELQNAAVCQTRPQVLDEWQTLAYVRWFERVREEDALTPFNCALAMGQSLRCGLLSDSAAGGVLRPRDHEWVFEPTVCHYQTGACCARL